MQNITINSIVRTTEKALLINCPVTWNENKYINKELWMPKSCVRVTGEHSADIEDWFYRKMKTSNAFHGYEMSFDTFAFQL